MTAMSSIQTPREEFKEITIRRILDAFFRLFIGESGVLDMSGITYARIAALAGVSERTVYRAFPSKADLQTAALQHGVWKATHYPQEVRAVPNYVREVTVALAAAVPESVKPPGNTGDDGALAPWYSDRREKARAILESVTATMPELSTEQQVHVASVLRTLSSVRSVVATAGDWGFTIEEAGIAHAWVMDQLLDRLSTESADGDVR